jgi:hypothetical protein
VGIDGETRGLKPLIASHGLDGGAGLALIKQVLSWGHVMGLRALVKKNRAIYKARYRDFRRKWVAHKELSDPEEIGNLFAKTNINELQQLVTTGALKCFRRRILCPNLIDGVRAVRSLLGALVRPPWQATNTNPVLQALRRLQDLGTLSARGH